MNTEYWLDHATRLIRFAPDRAAVRRELADHLQDRQETYAAQGLSPFEAQQAATASMGDPEEIAAELGRIHSPWWGWLWRLSQAALAILLLITISTAIRHFLPDDAHPAPERYRPALPEETVVYSKLPGKPERHLLQFWEPEGTVELGGYRFTAPLAYLQYMEPWTEADGATFGDYYELTMVVKASTLRFWEPLNGGQDMVMRQEPAVDSTGMTYAFNTLPHTAPANLFCLSHDGGPFTTWFEIQLTLSGPEAPEWVEVPMGYGGDSLRLDLEQEVLRP